MEYSAIKLTLLHLLSTATLLCVVYLLPVVTADIKQAYYHEAFKDQGLVSSQILGTSRTRSWASCAVTCTNNPSCLSYSIGPDTTGHFKCQLSPVSANDKTQTVFKTEDSPGTNIYYRTINYCTYPSVTPGTPTAVKSDLVIDNQTERQIIVHYINLNGKLNKATTVPPGSVDTILAPEDSLLIAVDKYFQVVPLGGACFIKKGPTNEVVTASFET